MVRGKYACHVSYGSKGDIGGRQDEVCYISKNGHQRPKALGPLRAKNRLMRCGKQAYSITWSARSNMEVGIVRMSTARLQGHHKMWLGQQPETQYRQKALPLTGKGSRG
jgi:hypothetical protein